MIFITTSNGVYLLRKGAQQAERVMGNKHTRGLFKRKARGYFGICLDPRNGDVLVASREKLGTPDAGKPATDCKLHRIDPQSLQHEVIAELRDLHDVHQIDAHGSHVYLTDTGKNRVHVYDLQSRQLTCMLNVGEAREDIHHLNAVHCEADSLLVGLNNRGNEESAILRVPYAAMEQNGEMEVEAFAIGELISHPDVHHTHDIEPWADDYLSCASHAGYVFRVSDQQRLIHMDNWVRGLCCDREGIWVGTSPLAERHQRHSEKMESCINHYSHDAHQLLHSIRLPGSGQVNDLLCIDED